MKGLDTPEYYATALKAEHTPQLLTALKVSLSSQLVSWLAKFIDLGGLSLLFNILKSVQLKPK